MIPVVAKMMIVYQGGVLAISFVGQRLPKAEVAPRMTIVYQGGVLGGICVGNCWLLVIDADKIMTVDQISV